MNPLDLLTAKVSFGKKTALVIALIVGMLALAFWPRAESDSQQRRRWRAEAEVSFNSRIKEVVGWRRTMKTSTDFYDPQYPKWRATAQVEFINPLGGVEVTNLHFKVQVNANGEKNVATCSFDHTADGRQFYTTK